MKVPSITIVLLALGVATNALPAESSSNGMTSNFKRGDHELGEGCTQDSDCKDGLICKMDELQIYSCRTKPGAPSPSPFIFPLLETIRNAAEDILESLKDLLAGK
ncbi:hypothetical protein TWF730_010996 [Orbilia blumenaviensis]|uniref:Uncharacterized protein n=1 Tax=Orbilia blumenaviensis TaxID=1796055 RepID=A0AAV9UJD4_9PEZI